LSEELSKILEKRKKREEHRKRLIQQKKVAEKSACECFSTDSGKEFLRWLIRESGFHQPSVIYNAESGDIKVDSTVYNEAKRDIYLRVRSLLKTRPDILAEVENDIKGEKR
jgi:hypothetical protein